MNGFAGTATASSATSLTDSGASWTASAYVGQIVVAAPTSGNWVYGVITANTATALTVDQWYNPNSPTGAAGSTPSATSNFVIMPGNAPAWYMALSTDSTLSTDIAAADTTLHSEYSHAGGGLNRAQATYAHTSNATSYTLSKTYTANGSDSLPSTIYGVGIFDALSGGTLMFETAYSTSATLSASGDQLTSTETVSM